MITRTVRVGLLASAALLSVCAASCAYYNTLYNARKLYREAEKSAETSASPREQREKYKEVVEKCAKVITEYPKSRWIDDAVFLMGMALLRQEEYEKSIRKFKEVLTNFPESEYAPRARYWIAFARHRKQDYEEALADVNRFLSEHPRHELRFEALFLGGDIKRSLGDDEEAIAFYERVAEKGGKAEILDEARLRSAELFYERRDWERAAANYERVLRKGLDWKRRYRISLRLGECYARTGRCLESIELTTQTLEKAAAADIPPLMLARGAGYECMDSLRTALAVYDEIVAKYPKSLFSAEAHYRKGIIYHERLDSLRAAQESFSKVGGEYANSEFAPSALEKSSSIKRLLDLEASSGAGGSADLAAEHLFMSAEIQLVKLNNVARALAGYVAVLDSFPDAASAPRAAYAVAWIHQHKLDRPDSAILLYRALVERYPRSPQVVGAVHELRILGAGELGARLRAYADSALADTAAAEFRDSIAAPHPPVDMPWPDTTASVMRPDSAANVMRPDTAASVMRPDTAANVMRPDTAATARGGDL